jgi:hypothetical protein
MINPIIQKKPYTPDNGDILSGGKYIVRKVKNIEDLGSLLSATALSNNPWKSLKMLNVETEHIRKAFQYLCPYTDNKYYHFIPAAIVIKNGVDAYRKPNYEDKSFDYLFDLDWVTNCVFQHKHPHLNSIGKSMLGHGYTDGTLPNDGHGNHIEVLIELDNDDYLFGYCWEWYNK